MVDRLSGHTPGLESPAQSGFAVTPADGQALAETTRALYVGAGGNLALTLAGGSQVTFANVPTGTLLPLRVAAVAATGTTASAIVGLV